MYIDVSNERSMIGFHKELDTVEILSLEDENKHIALAKLGNQKSKELLVKSHMKFIYSVAKTYANRGLPISDLISEGCIGFLKGIERYDPNSDIKLITYAVWWVREGMTKALDDHSRTVRLPKTTINKLKGDDINFATANKLNIRVPIESVFNIVEEEPEYSASADTKNIKHVEKLLGCLNDKERVVIKNSFGLGINKPLTLNQIGDIYGLTMERIRQIKKDAIFKMRENSYELIELLENE